MNPFDSISFEQALWLVPVFFALHNMEEAPFMAKWSKRLPIKILPPISTRQFIAAVTFLTAVGFLLTYLGLTHFPKPFGYLIILEIQAALAFNAFIPHLGSTVRFRMYSPGIVTAFLINLPFSYYLFGRALSENLITWNHFWGLLIIAPFFTFLAAWTALQFGKIFAREPAQ